MTTISVPPKEKQDMYTQHNPYTTTPTAKSYKTRKFVRSNMTTMSLVDTVSYVKDKGDGSPGDYVVDHHRQPEEKLCKIKKRTEKEHKKQNVN